MDAHERLVAGAFRVTGLLGSGATTHVLAGVELATGRPVAIKVARRRGDGGAALALLRHEARLLAEVKSPRLPRLLAFVDEEGEALLVTERIDGRPLAPGPRPWDEVRAIAREAAAALSSLHAAGIVHCDVTPDNLLVGPSGVTLIDLNVARAVGTTTGGQFIGSPPYMAPELWRGDPVSPATDVYALGALVFALAAGAPPFAGGTKIQWMRAHLDERPPTLAARGVSAPAIAETAIAAALAKDPTGRPQRARDLADAL